MKKLLLLLTFSFLFYTVTSQFDIGVESGLVFEGYNDVRIPNESSATKFSFSDDFELQGIVVPLRITLGYTFSDKNHLILLYAPLDVSYSSSIPFDINFQNELFPGGQVIDGYYKFNSYRLTYSRDLIVRSNWIFRLGFTAKIRDARVQLTTEDQSAKKDDLGFVPLLRIYTSYNLDRWNLFLEGDGLAGGPGRAFDFIFGSWYYLSGNFSLKAGYRILEGGADVDEVYNFTWINFVNLGV
ncbi:MAG: hypothetical protein ACOCUP_00965, partial [bacterium]